MSDNDKIMPCPFCGSEAVYGEIGEGDDAGGHFIQCTNGLCGASTNLQFALKENPKPLLVEQWNRRTRNTNPIAYLREIDAGTYNACWVICAKGDRGAIPVFPGGD